MDYRPILFVVALATMTAACQPREGATDAAAGKEPEAAADTAPAAAADNADYFEIAPGLSARILRNGYGRAAEPGDTAEVHYTGWLYDEHAPDHRGAKFDSSVDRGERFSFPLGAGRVIKGWDQGIVGMLIGETRELTIAPELAYGDRGAAGVIPPGATLVFEVELFSLAGPEDSG
jgi:FKBP-type peptidyl-prolyl cis-trans isomerase FkpA